MQLGMIGLGRMGGNMVERLLSHGHQCAVFDVDREARERAQVIGAQAHESMAALVEALPAPRVLWLMLPASVVDGVLAGLLPLLEAGDLVVDGGNSSWRNDIRRSRVFADAGVEYMDVGTSGGVRGRERGYCMMVGGSPEGFECLEPILMALAPGAAAAPPTPGRPLGGTAEQGYLHCGPAGAGHYVKMIHNAIEYGMMAAYAEGFNLMHQARDTSEVDGIPAVAHPELYQYDFNLAEIAELWRRGSVVGSWLLDLTAQALHQDPSLERYTGTVSDSGEGRWALGAAIDLGVPAPTLASALFSRFESRGSAAFAMKTLSAMREQFGGHLEAQGNTPGGVTPPREK
jgi:6-phosphogluconate dehydrogenase